jgi:transposase
MVHDLRAMVDAVGVRDAERDRVAGASRGLSAMGFGLRVLRAVEQARAAQQLTARLRDRLRGHQGRQAEPTACIIDSQIVKCADTVPAATSGYHRGKKIKGRGRHLVVDTEGWLLALVVTAASASDKAGAKLLAGRLAVLFSTLQLMWADACCDKRPLRKFMKETAGITLEIVKRASPHTFQVIRRRWVIERTFGWLTRHRRLARDYERWPEHHEAMVYWATVFIMTKRLTKYETGQPSTARWGGERPRPNQQAALSTGSKLRF